MSSRNFAPPRPVHAIVNIIPADRLVTLELPGSAVIQMCPADAKTIGDALGNAGRSFDDPETDAVSYAAPVCVNKLHDRPCDGTSITCGREHA